MSEEDKEKQSKGSKMIPIFMGVFIGIGYGIASAIHSFGSTDKYQTRIDAIKAWDLQWAYLSAFIWTILVVFLNLYPMQFKSKIMFSNSGNLRSNMHIYKLAAEGSSESAVVLNNDGDIGCYNRGNRSIYHFLENSQPALIGLVLNSLVYPFPVFVTVCFFAVGRILYTIGYSTKGYGAHAPGFILDRFATFTLVGQFLLIFFKAQASAGVVAPAATA